MKYPPPSETRVIVGMSGGVDSSVSALLLKQQGYRVEGLFMKNWDEDDDTEYCTAKIDLADAEKVCEKLEIPLHTANFAAEYWDNVFEYFLAEYSAGRTPNPDILCNREIKFRVFLDYAEALGADSMATGHYARKINCHRETHLYKGLDASKDQSYFLYAVGEEEFAKTLFPIGELEKTSVRKVAEQAGLINHDKRDSTGVCFIGERRFKDFLQQYIPPRPGEVIDDRGRVIGEHQGLMYYTIGQRQGLGIGGIKNTKEAPWYVAEKELNQNRLLVVQGNRHPLLYHQNLQARQVHWINSPPTERNFLCEAKVRYRQADQTCQVTVEKDGLCVHFETKQRAITPGQSLVLYQGGRCLGGAIIERRW